jgi:hypothetical protein
MAFPPPRPSAHVRYSCLWSPACAHPTGSEQGANLHVHRGLLLTHFFNRGRPVLFEVGSEREQKIFVERSTCGLQGAARDSIRIVFPGSRCCSWNDPSSPRTCGRFAGCGVRLRPHAGIASWRSGNGAAVWGSDVSLLARRRAHPPGQLLSKRQLGRSG